MGSDPNKEQVGKITPNRQSVFDFSEGQRNQSLGGTSDNEKEFTPLSQFMNNAYTNAASRQRSDYDSLMSGYAGFRDNSINPLISSIAGNKPAPITYTRSGDMAKAMGGYSTFADTGGYSPQDVQELRARGISPIRAAYGNTMQELDRARALGGPGGATNYIAAAGRAQRELPQQMADAMTGVNAQLAQDIRQGKLAGMQGLQQGAVQEAQLDQRAKELTQQGMSDWQARQIAANELGLKSFEGQQSLYGTTPGMASTFGNQALQSYNTRLNMEQLRQQTGLGMIDAQLRALGQQGAEQQPWWKQAIGIGTNVAGTLLG